MKRSTIASAFLLAGALSIGSLSACMPSKASNVTQPHVVAANTGTSAQPKLSPAERAKKRDEVRKQVEAVLTPQQVKQLDAKIKAGEKMGKALNQVNLSADQKTKVKAILKAAYPRM
ncbi:hypothetical protein IQ270_23455 [Microcoleus sp. LEGE 07076]|uniref:hypothetical protein n=1 Tax=Microcoleus sp. LEGE 07076 TaxID=915322 RepID=UPI0018806220|nr:hypothetical protein [Microcoleus sp. LEGE 07076]MBE9187521.1 hypothetical protein [Microcoleus sp. LEGE 07076]